MIINLLTMALNGFYFGTSLFIRSLNGMWGNLEGYNYPLSVSIRTRVLSVIITSKVRAVVIDQ